MQAYPNAYPVAGAQPVRYMVPGNYGQPYPPFVNRSYDRFALMPATYRAPAVPRPAYYPPSYGPGYGQGAGANQPAGNQPARNQPAQTQHAPTVTAPKPTVQAQRPSQGGLFNPNRGKKNSVSSATGSKTPGLKKGAKEFKDTAFTIEPDGSKNEAIRGLVSNDDINNLLKHKGTKVKVSKIYRITKTKPEELSESEDEAPPPPKPKAQRPRSPSEDSYCSLCAAEQSHVDDDCPECRALRQQVHVYDDCPECRAQRQQVHVYDDCPLCRAEQEREAARRQSVK
ncbi:unnamed protein product [Adineta ricciae]|uniref:Uncharacterized protein n=1 Tax=Adineta ricciae TaxID=249248 RepID=A0A813WES8_ADIRI|nr:unnamed protein product [Adineta ricciae]CAF1281171.1 unnamed protein product [Adineta ricciae]